MRVNAVSRESVRSHLGTGDLDRVYEALFGPPSATTPEPTSMTTDVKLELASAYIYLGDFDSARELLEAVQIEGTGTQSLRARNALTALPLAMI